MLLDLAEKAGQPLAFLQTRALVQIPEGAMRVAVDVNGVFDARQKLLPEPKSVFWL